MIWAAPHSFLSSILLLDWTKLWFGFLREASETPLYVSWAPALWGTSELQRSSGRTAGIWGHLAACLAWIPAGKNPTETEPKLKFNDWLAFCSASKIYQHVTVTQQTKHSRAHNTHNDHQSSSHTLSTDASLISSHSRSHLTMVE